MITRARALPADMDALLTESRDEGFGLLDRLVTGWESGENTFTGEGEALFVARIAGRLVGVCGVNRDPYLDAATVGRLRHLYVARDVRLLGVGRRLVEVAIDHARPHFDRIRLRTGEASEFYARVGFQKAFEENATHEMLL